MWLCTLVPLRLVIYPLQLSSLDFLAHLRQVCCQGRPCIPWISVTTVLPEEANAPQRGKAGQGREKAPESEWRKKSNILHALGKEATRTEKRCFSPSSRGACRIAAGVEAAYVSSGRMIAFPWIANVDRAVQIGWFSVDQLILLSVVLDSARRSKTILLLRAQGLLEQPTSLL